MRFVLIAAALALPSGASLAQQENPAPRADKFAGVRLDCMANDVRYADQWQKPKFNRLGDLPPGDLQLAVVRQVQGCQEPVIVRQGYGAMARPERRGR